MSEWSIRSLLNPVITRLLIYGVNPIDVESVLTLVESQHLVNIKSLESIWLTAWAAKASCYKKLGEQAEKESNFLSASKYFFYAAQCYYATFLINFAEIKAKKNIYTQYAQLYRKSVAHSPFLVEYVEIPLGKGALPGYLHLPEQEKDDIEACTVVFSGLGSCKEEMHILARPLVERGIAAFVPDMPGNGEALFTREIKCRFHDINTAFSKIIDILTSRKDLQDSIFGAYGLCMGGGYAHKATCTDPRYSFCATLFPLFITQVTPGVTPQWMKQGEWYNYQTGKTPAEDFLEEMRNLEKGTLKRPLLFIHGKHDNWMSLEAATKFFDKAQAEKEKIIIEEEAVFSNQQVITHTMPVGEQLHWVKHYAADWIVSHSHR